MPTADFTIAEFLAWVRTKPVDEAYRFTDIHNCAVAQFGRATNRLYLVGNGSLDQYLNNKAIFAVALSVTFGELVSELESIVEPSLRKRVWAKVTGKPIGGEFVPPLSDTWTKADAYLTDVEAVESVSA